MPTDPTVEEATRRSGVIWVAFDDQPPLLVWHVWHAGAAWLVGGGLEQALPVDPSRAVVTVRSKASQNDVVAVWSASVTAVPPGSPQWLEVAPLLHEKRLNPPDGEAQPERWARESVVLRLTPL